MNTYARYAFILLEIRFLHNILQTICQLYMEYFCEYGEIYIFIYMLKILAKKELNLINELIY